MGFLEDEESLVQTSWRGTYEMISVRKEWASLLRTSIRLNDQALALRLRIEPQLTSGEFASIDPYTSSRISDRFFKRSIELVPHMRKARELLHGWRRSQQGMGPIVPIAAWDNFKRGLDCWERNRHSSQTGESNTSLFFEPPYILTCW